MTASSDLMSNGAIFQNSAYIGMNIENILYGIELFLYFKTIHILLTDRGARTKVNLSYALFSSTILFLVTVWVATEAIFGEQMWLLHPDYPGGPNAYWQEHISTWYMNWGMTAAIILQLMTDALMIYRCWIIWNNYRAIVIPTVLWLATLTLGLSVDAKICSPGGNFFAGVTAKLGLAYYTVSMFLHTTLTCMICYHIMRHARKIQEHVGHEHASLYFTIITIIVESVFPYTLTGIAFLISLGIGSPTSVAFISVYLLMMCISPQVLILRVIVGRALDKDTFKRPASTIKFDPGTLTRSQPFDTSAARVHLQTLSNVYLPDGHTKV